MSTSNRYSGPGRRGANRPMSTAEQTQWSAAVANWHDDPPWTEQAKADNLKVRTLLVTLFEDGVSLADLATAANWGKPKTAGVLHRARQAGLGTGTRRYIERQPTARQRAQASKAPFRRALTEQEAQTLTGLYNALPVHAGNARGWKNPTGQRLYRQIQALLADDVALETIGATLGMKRQAVHDRMSKPEPKVARVAAPQAA